MHLAESTAESFVLLVDPDTDEREMYAFALSKEGLPALEADSAEAAVALAMEKPPALVITDAVLPGQDGLEFTRRLRDERATEAIPVIVVSGRVTDAAQARSDALTAGADLFLLKPCSPQDLIREARRLIDQSCELRKRSLVQHGLAAQLQARSAELLDISSKHQSGNLATDDEGNV